MCISDPDRSPVGIDGSDIAPTPTGLAEVVSDDFPILHGCTLDRLPVGSLSGQQQSTRGNFAFSLAFSKLFGNFGSCFL
jgi:hypothetical protein